MTAQTERQKTAELMTLLQRVTRIPQHGLAAFIRRHLDELPTWRDYLGSDVTNPQIASKVGRRLSSLAYQDRIYCGGGSYMTVEDAQTLGIMRETKRLLS